MLIDSWAIKRKLSRLASMPMADLLLFVEAVLDLGRARFYVRFCNFRRFIYKVGAPLNQETLSENLPAQDLSLARRISREVSRAARTVPWNAVCLPQAMAAKWMLQRRGVSSIMFLGVAKARNEQPAPEKIATELEEPGLKAHAWLKAGNYVVTGRKGHQQFRVVGRFR